MTIKKIAKVKGSVQDLALGSGKLTQTRNGKSVEVDKIPAMLTFPTEADMKAADYLVVGMIAQTFGQTTINDGLGKTFQIVSSSGDVVLDNGSEARIVSTIKTSTGIQTIGDAIDDRATRLTLEKSVAGGSNVTLTQEESASAVITFTGALTDNISVIVPAESRQWLIINDTTGAFTLTVTTSSGTGISVAQNKQRSLRCDGTNVVTTADSASSSSSISALSNTLSELKNYDGAPGDYVKNTGKLTATDGKGADWFIVNNTGSAGDDIDLIDFSNGTQGVRISNQLYLDKYLSEIFDAGAGARNTARSNLGVYSTEESVGVEDYTIITEEQLGGDFDTNMLVNIAAVDVNGVKIVTVSCWNNASTGSKITHSSGSPTSTYALPPALRPNGGVNYHIIDIAGVDGMTAQARVTSSGTIQVLWIPTDGVSGTVQTSVNQFSISYVVS